MDMRDSLPLANFSRETRDPVSERINQTKFENSNTHILKIINNLKPIISIDTAVRLTIDTSKSTANSSMLTLPFKIDNEVVYHNIARLLYNSLIAYYLKNDPNTSHVGLASVALEGVATSLLRRDAEKLLRMAGNRDDIAGQLIRGVNFTVETPETNSPTPVFTETLVNGLDIHIGLDIAIYGASLNYNRIFIPIPVGGPIIEKIYHNLEQIIQQKLITYDEVNEKYLKISETLLFKEVEKVLNHLRYKINTRRKLLADLKVNTLFPGQAADQNHFNLTNDGKLKAKSGDSDTQSSPTESKISEQDLVGHGMGISHDLKKKQEANQSMQNYRSFLENIKQTSQSSKTVGEPSQKQVIAYGTTLSTSSDTGKKNATGTFSQSDNKAVSMKTVTQDMNKKLSGLEKTITVDVQSPPNITVASAKNITERESFTVTSGPQPIEHIKAQIKPDIDFSRNQRFVSPSTDKFAKRANPTTNQKILNHSGHKNRHHQSTSPGSFEDRNKKMSAGQPQLPNRFSERVHSEHPLQTIREVTADTPVKSAKMTPRSMESNTTIIEDRKIKEQERPDHVESKNIISKTTFSDKNPMQTQQSAKMAKVKTSGSNKIPQNTSAIQKYLKPEKVNTTISDSNSTKLNEAIKSQPSKPTKVNSKTIDSNRGIIENEQQPVSFEQKRIAATIDSNDAISNENQNLVQTRPVFPSLENQGDTQLRTLSFAKPQRSAENQTVQSKIADQPRPVFPSLENQGDTQLRTLSYIKPQSDISEELKGTPGKFKKSATVQGPIVRKNIIRPKRQKKIQLELPKNSSKIISQLLAEKYDTNSSTQQKVSRESQYYLGTGNFILPDIMPNEPSGFRNRPTKLIIIGENNHCGGDQYCAGKRILENDCNALRSVAGYGGMDLTCVVTMTKIQLDALNAFLGTDTRSPNKLAMRVEDADEIIEIIRKKVIRSAADKEKEYSNKEIFQLISNLLLEKLYANKDISKHFYGLTIEVPETKSFKDLDPIIIKKFRKVLAKSYQILNRAAKK